MAEDKVLKLRHEEIARRASNKLMVDFLLSLFVAALLVFIYRGFNGSGAALTRDVVGWFGALNAVVWVGYWIAFFVRKKHTYFRLDWFFLLMAVGAAIFFIPGVITKYLIYVYAIAIPIYWIGVIIFYTNIYYKIMLKK